MLRHFIFFHVLHYRPVLSLLNTYPQFLVYHPLPPCPALPSSNVHTKLTVHDILLTLVQPIDLATHNLILPCPSPNA